MATESNERPAFCTEDMLVYLDDLRVSGVTNMFGAGPYVAKAFRLNKEKSTAVLLYWMHSFSERRAADKTHSAGSPENAKAE